MKCVLADELGQLEFKCDLVKPYENPREIRAF